MTMSHHNLQHHQKKKCHRKTFNKLKTFESQKYYI